MCHWTPQVHLPNPSNGLSSGQSDHATEKSVGIGGIASTARAILPNNVLLIIIN